MKIIHLADLHLSSDPDKVVKAEASLKELVSYCEQNPIDFMIIAGDVWDRAQSYIEKSGIELAYKYLDRFSELVKGIFIVKGNSAHDAVGSIALLHQRRPNIYAYEYAVTLGVRLTQNGLTVADLFREQHPESLDLIVHGFPYPAKSMFLSESIDNSNADFAHLFSQLIRAHGKMAEHYPDVPSVGIFHGNIYGAQLNNGQKLVGQDVLIPSGYLDQLGASYYALGHIHLAQEIAPDMFYSGSLYNKDFGETDQKGFNVYLVEEDAVQRINFQNQRPMVLLENEFYEGQFQREIEELPENAEVRFRYTVRDIEVKQAKEKVQELGLPEDAKIVPIVLPSTRTSRSEDMAKLDTLADEIREYARVTEADVNVDSAIKRAYIILGLS